MNDFLLALSCLPHKKVPLWELEFHLWGEFSSKNFACGKSFFNLSKSDKEKALYLNAEIISEDSLQLGFSCLTVPGGYWELAPGIPAYYWLPEDYRFRQAKIIKEMLPPAIVLAANTGGVMAMPGAENYVEFSCKLFENPGEIDRMAEKTLNDGLENIKRFADLGVEVMLTASDLADNSGPYFDPEQMQRFILPYLSKWAEAVKNAGAKPILHTDGNINLYLDHLADSGINAIQAIDPVAGMEIAETLERAKGRICLCGNIDCGLLLTGTPDEVFYNTQSLLEKTKRFNGFALGASNAVQAEVPVENYRAMVAALNQVNYQNSL